MTAAGVIIVLKTWWASKKKWGGRAMGRRWTFQPIVNSRGRQPKTTRVSVNTERQSLINRESEETWATSMDNVVNVCKGKQKIEFSGLARSSIFAWISWAALHHHNFSTLRFKLLSSSLRGSSCLSASCTLSLSLSPSLSLSAYNEANFGHQFLLLLRFHADTLRMNAAAQHRERTRNVTLFFTNLNFSLLPLLRQRVHTCMRRAFPSWSIFIVTRLRPVSRDGESF